MFPTGAIAHARQERLQNLDGITDAGFLTCFRIVSVIRGYIINVVVKGLEASQQIPISNK